MLYLGLFLGRLGPIFEVLAEPFVVLMTTLHPVLEVLRGLRLALAQQCRAVRRVVIVAAESAVVTHRDNPSLALSIMNPDNVVVKMRNLQNGPGNIAIAQVH